MPPGQLQTDMQNSQNETIVKLQQTFITNMNNQKQHTTYADISYLIIFKLQRNVVNDSKIFGQDGNQIRSNFSATNLNI